MRDVDWSHTRAHGAVALFNCLTRQFRVSLWPSISERQQSSYIRVYVRAPLGKGETSRQTKEKTSGESRALCQTWKQSGQTIRLIVFHLQLDSVRQPISHFHDKPGKFVSNRKPLAE